MSAGGETAAFEGWTILELMGHRRLGGYVREVTVAGHGFLRIDVPGEPGQPDVATQFYPPTSVYAMTPTTEEMARAVARSARPEPVKRWELPPAPEASPKTTISHPDTDECPDDECVACGERDCPRKDPLHYHHDGCPSCSSSDQCPNCGALPNEPCASSCQDGERF